MSSVRHLDLAVLHVLRVDELDLVEHAQFLQQDGADQAIEVAPGHEPTLLGRVRVAIRGGDSSR